MATGSASSPCQQRVHSSSAAATQNARALDLSINFRSNRNPFRSVKVFYLPCARFVCLCGGWNRRTAASAAAALGSIVALIFANVSIWMKQMYPIPRNCNRKRHKVASTSRTLSSTLMVFSRAAPAKWILRVRETSAHTHTRTHLLPRTISQLIFLCTLFVELLTRAARTQLFPLILRCWRDSEINFIHFIRVELWPGGSGLCSHIV